MFKPSTVWPLWTVAGWGGWLVLVRLLVTLITSGYASQNRCFIKVTVPNQRVDNKTQVGQWHSKVKNRDAWDSTSKEDSTSKNNVMVLFSSSCRGLGWGCLSITETYRTNTNKKTRSNWWLIYVSLMHLQSYWLLPIHLCLEGNKSRGWNMFASTAIGLWREGVMENGPLLQEELCPTSLPWWTDHFPEMYRRNLSFLDPSSRWVHLGRSRDNMG